VGIPGDVAPPWPLTYCLETED